VGDSRLSIFRGDITTIQADAIVCPIDPGLDFRSGLANIVGQAAGPTIQNQRPEFPEPYGKIVVLPGGNLKVKYLFLAVLLGEKSVDKLKAHIRQSVERSIRYAEFLRLKSLAFPVLGCPKIAPPYLHIAHEMIEHVVQYMRCRNTKVKTLFFSIFNQNALEDFQTEAKKFGQSL
jgi:O-acetyl-ADP-ribose deacetylase (regulator of RNase III)